MIGFTRAVPDLVWALLFVTAVGLGPFPGGLALSVHSIGMLGRLFAETIENMDMAPIDALALTGANRMQVFTHGVVPIVLPSLLGIGLYRLDENIRSSLVLGFVGAGGIGFQLLTAMNLFQYREVSLLLIVIFVIVFAAERLSAVARAACLIVGKQPCALPLQERAHRRVGFQADRALIGLRGCFRRRRSAPAARRARPSTAGSPPAAASAASASSLARPAAAPARLGDRDGVVDRDHRRVR